MAYRQNSLDPELIKMQEMPYIFVGLGGRLMDFKELKLLKLRSVTQNR